jgi:hypothetical protein
LPLACTVADNGYAGPNFYQFQKGIKVTTGLPSGPLLFFSQDATQALMFSAASQFMGASIDQNSDGNLRFGPLGSFETIPAHVAYDSVLWWGPGANAASMAWGDALLRMYGKPHDGSRRDFTNTHLIYNTDHGMWAVMALSAHSFRRWPMVASPAPVVK